MAGRRLNAYETWMLTNNAFVATAYHVEGAGLSERFIRGVLAESTKNVSLCAVPCDGHYEYRRDTRPAIHFMERESDSQWQQVCRKMCDAGTTSTHLLEFTVLLSPDVADIVMGASHSIVDGVFLLVFAQILDRVLRGGIVSADSVPDMAACLAELDQVKGGDQGSSEGLYFVPFDAETAVTNSALFNLFSVEETSAIVRRSKAEHVTVGNTVNMAVAVALHAFHGMAVTAVSLRVFTDLRPTLGLDRASPGSLTAPVYLDVAVDHDTPFFSRASAMGSELRGCLVRRENCVVPQSMLQGHHGLLDRRCTVEMSNIGRWDLDNEGCTPRLCGLQFWQTLDAEPSALCCPFYTINGRLLFCIDFMEPLYSVATIERLIALVAGVLRAVCVDSVGEVTCGEVCGRL